MPPDWQSTHYSVAEHSYFHLGAVPVLHALKDVVCDGDELLLLSPFRPQRSLFSALAFDLKEEGGRATVAVLLIADEAYVTLPVS